jgi:hypothetical protein
MTSVFIQCLEFSFAIFALGRNSAVFFESGWTVVHHVHSQASGNPVRIGDGCATVTGYKLPKPLVHQAGKAGARFQARSQDTGLAVLVVVCNPSRRRTFTSSGSFVLRQLLRQREG